MTEHLRHFTLESAVNAQERAFANTGNASERNERGGNRLSPKQKTTSGKLVVLNGTLHVRTGQV